MNVELISWTNDPIGTCAKAASMCYDSEPSRKIVKGCIKSGHASIIEHANYTFKITGVSRSLLAQLTRHRHASYSVQSQRYVSYTDGVEFVDPVFANDKVEEIFTNNVMSSLRDYEEMMEHGAKAEDARAVLPNAMPTSLVMTMNLRGLMNFMNERLCTRAQAEIRKMAKLMKDAVVNCPDHTDEDKEIINMVLVPKCERYAVAFCPEYQSCGRHKKLTELVTPQ